MIKGYSLNGGDLPKEKIFFDSEDDLPELEAYAVENGLSMGSLAVNCENGDEYLLNSAGKWHKKGA